MGQNAHTPQERVARKLCELMDDEWELGRNLYMDKAEGILSDVGFHEMRDALREAHKIIVNDIIACAAKKRDRQAFINKVGEVQSKHAGRAASTPDPTPLPDPIIRDESSMLD